ncbi:MAG: AmmeMemoRadiSam system protein B [Desulfobacteraceae bacterium]|nr:AmmeMemoRadiSam system protein B [Desulfobacteraceae bacterium]
MDKKKAAFAGSWYPATPGECEEQIQTFIHEKQGILDGSFAGGIVPHAGWYYSGSIACRVIGSLKSQTKIDTVVLLGAHMHPQSEPFILTHGVCETPLGDLMVDEELVSHITDGISIRKRDPMRFPDENTLELQYPFVKYFFPDAMIVSAGVAPSNFASIIAHTIVESAQKLSRKIVVVGSTDMTHYGSNFGFTPAGTGEKAVDWVKNENDKNAIDVMLEMDDAAIISQGLDHKNMCCAGAAAATAAACKKMGAAKAMTLDYATSYEKSASESFVGYSGILYSLS